MFKYVVKYTIQYGDEVVSSGDCSLFVSEPFVGALPSNWVDLVNDNVMAQVGYADGFVVVIDGYELVGVIGGEE